MAKAKPISERLASIKAQQEKLAAKERQLEAKDRSEQRKRETRRKIVVGAAVLTAIEKDPAFAHSVMRILAASVGRAQDKEVIADLLPPVSPLPANESQQPTPAAVPPPATTATISTAAPPPPQKPLFDLEGAKAALKSTIFNQVKTAG